MPGTSDDDGEVETQRTRQTRNNASEMVSIAYNKRDAYFSMPELIAKRMNRRIVHYPCLAQQLNVTVRGHSNRHPLPPRHPAVGDDPDADPDQAVRADPDAAPVGDLLPPAVGASVAADQHNDSQSQQDDEDYYSAQQVDVEVPEEESDDAFTGDDDNEGSERPAIRRRLSTSVITVPLRWTRQSC
ncbi:hypothetical protein MHU86_4362 [Fragilaria crotonensis]|nr:hypothetical protein MHU86_4362 [Fragilaria crotonensis]